jgi:bacterioferritin
MKGDPQVIRHLNSILTSKLTAINQYFLQSRMLRNIGLLKLGEHIQGEARSKMQQADRLIERILFLDGLPNLQNLGKLRIGENPEEVLRCDLALEMQAIPDLRAGIAHCESVADYVTRDLFEAILKSEEDHVDWLETQLGLIARLGAGPYLQTKLKD